MGADIIDVLLIIILKSVGFFASIPLGLIEKMGVES